MIAGVAVVLFNPNSSTLITEAMANHVRRALGSDGWYSVTNNGAPEVLSSTADFELAERSMLESLSSKPFRAIVIGAFGNPGLEALKSTGSPVVGMGSTALLAAASYRSFGVVTPAKAHADLAWRLVERSGIAAQCAAIEPLGVDPIRMLTEPAGAYREFEQVVEALAAAGAQVVCLGSSSLAALVDDLRPRSSVPLIDALALSVELAMGLPI